jgi:hypothetical protein
LALSPAGEKPEPQTRGIERGKRDAFPLALTSFGFIQAKNGDLLAFF